MVQQSLLEGITYWSEVSSAEGDIDVYALGDEAQLNQEGVWMNAFALCNWRWSVVCWIRFRHPTI